MVTVRLVGLRLWRRVLVGDLAWGVLCPAMAARRALLRWRRLRLELALVGELFWMGLWRFCLRFFRSEASVSSWC